MQETACEWLSFATGDNLPAFFFFEQCAHEEHDEQVTRKTVEMTLISKLIRSHRDDEQGKSWEPGAQEVAQYFADVTFWNSISRARWPFLEANVPVVVSLMVPLVTPLDEL